ncbi:hypothetical protein GOBAR_AA25279 [Gossypium barbadense]|uniref:Uncharacterized protein n=1 Tax=Gossypium barbadense TaxID=3634 RepID=A0A2P5WWC7_GOSBA|nr:hypothetical protein GOBAR_AA25279 [Gossypium barbadense]
MAWVRVPGLPGFMYKRKVLEVISSTTGKVAKFDFKTDNRTRGQFSRMAVFINLDKLLVSQILVNGSSKESDKSAVDDEPRRTNCELGKGIESAFRLWMLVERKKRIGFRFDVFTDENEMTSDERGIAKEAFRVLAFQAIETDLAFFDSRVKGIPKFSPKSQNWSAKGSSLGFETQKRNNTLVVVRAGGGSQSDHGIDRLRLKSLGKKPMHDFGLNVPSVGPLSKFNPASPCLQVYPTEADQPNTCAPLKLWGAGSSGKLVEGFEPPIQTNKLDGIKAYFNPTFEGPVEVEVQLTKSSTGNKDRKLMVNLALLRKDEKIVML